MLIRRFHPEDAPDLARLFYETVRTVNLRDYTPEEVAAWAPGIPDSEKLGARLAGTITYVAQAQPGPSRVSLADSQVEHAPRPTLLGFANLEPDSHIDLFYIHREHVGRGVGNALYGTLENHARSLGLTRLFVEASITARPFFEKQGFRVVRRQEVQRLGVPLVNFVMEKRMNPPNAAQHP